MRLTHLLYGTTEGGVTVLLVHVVGVRTRDVADGDAEVLHGAVVALADLTANVRNLKQCDGVIKLPR